MTDLIAHLILIAFGFLMGSIPFCYILPKKFLHKDICELSDDKNPGTANVFTVCGISMGFICLFLELGKGILPIILAKRSIETSSFVFGAVMAAPVLGHAIGIFRNFHGGKCIAVSFGVLLGILPFYFPVLTLAAIYIFFSTVIKINPNRKRSIVTFVLFGFITSIILAYKHEYAIAFGCMVIAATATIKHLRHFMPVESTENVDTVEQG